jgi:hypothetical protein
MRVIVSLFALLSIFISGGCAIIEQERSNRGGYLDYLLDQHWIKADSKGMRALRAYAIQVSLARIASVSAKNDSDRQLLAIRIGHLRERFLPIYACAFNKNPLGVAGAENDPCFYYDSAMVEYATGLFDLAMVALPVEDAKKLIDTATGALVNPINLAELLNTLIAIGKDALKYGRIVGALYRDTVELEVQAWLATPAIDDRPFPYRVTEADVAMLRAIYAAGNDNMPAWFAAIAELRSRGLEPLAHPKFFDELGGLMKYICAQITQQKEALDSCQKALPRTLPDPTPVLSSSSRTLLVRTAVSRGFRESIPSGGSRGPISGRPDSGGRVAMATGGRNDVERNISMRDLQIIQANLCVPPTGDIDSATREGIRQAKMGANQSGLAVPGHSLFNNTANEIKSRMETQAFLDAKKCTKDTLGTERAYLTAFEKFRFPDRAAINDLRHQLNTCDPNLNLKDSETFDQPTRNAIFAVKGKASPAERNTFGDLKLGTLNDRSYEFITRCTP